MEVAYTSHDLTAKISQGEIVVTLTRINTGETLHWTWNRERMTKEHMLNAINEYTSPQIQGMLLNYIGLSKDEKARHICSALREMESLSGEEEITAINNLGAMLILPYVLESKAWEMMQTHGALDDHNTLCILVDINEHGYVIRPMATLNADTHEQALTEGVNKALATAQMAGWLKEVNGKLSLVNQQGQSVNDIAISMSKGKPKPGAPGSNVTKKKNRKKRK